MNRGIKKGLLLVAGCCMAAGLPDRALAASYNDDTADSYLSRIYTEAEDWISAVSYTHLDVYKRQAANSCNPSELRVFRLLL